MDGNLAPLGSQCEESEESEENFQMKHEASNNLKMRPAS
jgi:hypothetical protein